MYLTFLLECVHTFDRKRYNFDNKLPIWGFADTDTHENHICHVRST